MFFFEIFQNLFDSGIQIITPGIYEVSFAWVPTFILYFRLTQLFVYKYLLLFSFIMGGY